MSRRSARPRTAKQTRTARTKGGFTLAEVMFSMVILTIVMFAVISGLATTNQADKANHETAVAREIVQSMTERIMGASWGSLGRQLEIPGSNGWSWHRRASQHPFPPTVTPAPTPAYTNPFYGPLVEYPTWNDYGETTADSRNLLVQGILSAPSGLTDLCVYVEYYKEALTFQVQQRITALNWAGDPTYQWYLLTGNPQKPIWNSNGDLLHKTLMPYVPSPPDANLANAANYFPEDHDVFDLNPIDKSVLVRILVSWKSITGRTDNQTLVAQGTSRSTVRWHEAYVIRRK